MYEKGKEVYLCRHMQTIKDRVPRIVEDYVLAPAHKADVIR